MFVNKKIFSDLKLKFKIVIKLSHPIIADKKSSPGSANYVSLRQFGPINF